MYSQAAPPPSARSAAAIDLSAQSAAAGSASLLIANLLIGGAAGADAFLGITVAVSVIAHLMILVFEHVFAPSPTRHHELATQTILKGAYSRLFWGGAILGGGVLPVVMLLTLGATFSPLVGIAAALLALGGGAAWEYIWVEAGQSVPLS